MPSFRYMLDTGLDDLRRWDIRNVQIVINDLP